MVLQPGLVDAIWLGVLILVSGVSAWSGALAVRDAREATPADLTAAEKRSIYRNGSALLWILAAGTLGWWGLAGRDLASLGLAAPRWTWPAAGAALALIVWLAVDTARQTAPSRISGTRERWRIQNPYILVSGPEFRSYAVLAVSAGIGEEIAYRGFMIVVLRAWLGPGWDGAALAVGLPALFFGAAHASQGWRGVVVAAGGALAWGIMVIETGSVWPGMVFHVLWNLFMGWLGFRFLRPSPTETRSGRRNAGRGREPKQPVLMRLTACGETHAAFDGRCIPPERAASRPSALRFGRNTPGIPPSRALSGGRLTRLGAHAGSTTGH